MDEVFARLTDVLAVLIVTSDLLIVLGALSSIVRIFVCTRLTVCTQQSIYAPTIELLGREDQSIREVIAVLDEDVVTILWVQFHSDAITEEVSDLANDGEDIVL
jgi:replicative superfamily II helicase